MANILSAVRTYVLSKSAVTDIIGQRMYFDRLRQNATLPAATISKISDRHDHAISDRSGLVWSRLQIVCFAATRLACDNLAEAIYQCGIVGHKGPTSTDVANIRGVMVEDGQRSYTLDARDGSDDHVCVTEFDLMVSYLES